MEATEIGFTPDNQAFSIVIDGVSYQMRVVWREAFWVLDIMDATGSLIIAGIPLIPGMDLLTQYKYLGLGFSLFVICDIEGQEYPTQDDLGTQSHLYAVME
ncbi:phage baseplate plug protein [Superficieibacter sp. BNK-5]|uniref:phage baseplate plug family protein n=1 Tax=Superficieibacter sp. BNK-5 TaxID=3376142 RepID=UPI0039BFCFDC